jgi:putative ABC transport system permease protein
VVLAGLNERRRELAVLRAVGAGPRQVLVLLAIEGALVTLVRRAAGRAGLRRAADRSGAARHRPCCRHHTGNGAARPLAWGPTRWQLMARALLAGGLRWPVLVPGWRAYRLSLADGLQARV